MYVLSGVNSVFRVSTVFFSKSCYWINSSNGLMVRASASRTADSGLPPSQVELMTLKLIFTAFLFDVQH